MSGTQSWASLRSHLRSEFTAHRFSAAENGIKRTEKPIETLGKACETAENCIKMHKKHLKALARGADELIDDRLGVEVGVP